MKFRSLTADELKTYRDYYKYVLDCLTTYNAKGSQTVLIRKIQTADVAKAKKALNEIWKEKVFRKLIKDNNDSI
jgi:hypothetical protein